MRNILIVAGGVVAVAAIALGVYFGTRPPAAGPPPIAVGVDRRTSPPSWASCRATMCWATPRPR